MPIAYFLGSVETIQEDFWSADIKVNSHTTEFKLDSGSKITVIGEQTPWVANTRMEPSSAKFCGPGGVNLSHLILGKIQDAQLRVQDSHHQDSICHEKPAEKSCQSLL